MKLRKYFKNEKYTNASNSKKNGKKCFWEIQTQVPWPRILF